MFNTILNVHITPISKTSVSLSLYLIFSILATTRPSDYRLNVVSIPNHIQPEQVARIVVVPPPRAYVYNAYAGLCEHRWFRRDFILSKTGVCGQRCDGGGGGGVKN